MRIKNAVEKARDLRRRMTPQEITLWKVIRRKWWKLPLGYKFRRQEPIEQFIADFCCYEKRLIVELDGGGHDASYQKEYDRERTDQFGQLGFKVLRFRNDQIDQNLDWVLAQIGSALERPSPPAGEGT